MVCQGLFAFISQQYTSMAQRFLSRPILGEAAPKRCDTQRAVDMIRDAVEIFGVRSAAKLL